jgi:hypothetical protein
LRKDVVDPFCTWLDHFEWDCAPVDSSRSASGRDFDLERFVGVTIYRARRFVLAIDAGDARLELVCQRLGQGDFHNVIEFA